MAMEESRPNRFLFLLAIGGAAASVLAAWALSVATDDFYLPVVGSLRGPLSVVFLLLPTAATIVFGGLLGYSTRVVWGAAFVAGFVTAVLAWIVWIGWIFVVCGLQDNACFD
jgi:hypothetical protein